MWRRRTSRVRIVHCGICKVQVEVDDRKRLCGDGEMARVSRPNLVVGVEIVDDAVDVFERQREEVAARVRLKLHHAGEREIGGRAAELGRDALIELAGCRRERLRLVCAKGGYSRDGESEDEGDAKGM